MQIVSWIFCVVAFLFAAIVLAVRIYSCYFRFGWLCLPFGGALAATIATRILLPGLPGVHVALALLSIAVSIAVLILDLRVGANLTGSQRPSY